MQKVQVRPEVLALSTASGTGAETTGGLFVPGTTGSTAFSFDHDPLLSTPERRSDTAATPSSDTNVRGAVSGK